MSGQVSDAKVRKAAQDFEAILLSFWLGGMQKAFSGSLGTEDPASSSLQGLGLSAVSSALAASGGVGIAQMILDGLQREPAQPTDTESVNEIEVRSQETAKAFRDFADGRIVGTGATQNED
jgi:Rod binding domain-containing protein